MSKVRSWCFTIYAIDEFKLNEAPPFRYACIANETCPDTGRLHLQGYIEFTRPCRRTQVQRILGVPLCHCAPRRGSRDSARNYCKDPTKVGFIQYKEYGSWVTTQGARTDLADAKRAIDDGISPDDFEDKFFSISARHGPWVQRYFARRLRLTTKHWRVVTTILYWGDTETGKTRKALEDAGEDYYLLPIPQNGTLWWDGYIGQKTLVIDEFYGQIKYSMLLRILDGHPYQMPVKFGFTHGAWTKVYMTSNTPWDEWYSTVPDVRALERRITQIVHFQLPLMSVPRPADAASMS